MTAPLDPSGQRHANKAADTADPCYQLVLFVSGASDLSARAISNVRRLGEAHLGGRFELAVVDVHGDASAVRHYDVVATPTLLLTSPAPVRRVVGDLSDAARVLLGLGLLRDGTTPGRPR